MKRRRRHHTDGIACDSDRGGGARAHDRARAKIDLRAFSEKTVQVVVGYKDILDRVFDAGGRFLARGRAHGHVGRRRAQGQRRSIRELHRLEEDVDRAVDVRRLSTAHISNLDAHRRAGRSQRHAV